MYPKLHECTLELMALLSGCTVGWHSAHLCLGGHCEVLLLGLVVTLGVLVVEQSSAEK